MLARLRTDAPHHSGARRRSGGPCRPPDVAHVLRLQRTIGNRATTRLLQREPTLTDEEARADFEQERARFEAYERTHQQRLAEYAQRAKPHALKSAGIATDSRIDEHTPEWIQSAFAESQILRPFLRNKFPASAATAAGKFKIYDNEEAFNVAAQHEENDSRQLTKTERAAIYGSTGGFFDRQSKTVHVRSRSQFGNALHEAMHRVAHPAFHGFWDRFVNEGVTQFFTDELLKEQGLPEVLNHTYQAELACAKQLVAATSWELVASAYFLNDQRLRTTLERSLSLDTDALRRELRAQTFCRRL